MKELICGNWLKDTSVHGNLNIKIVFDNVDQMENDPDFAAMFDGMIKLQKIREILFNILTMFVVWCAFIQLLFDNVIFLSVFSWWNTKCLHELENMLCHTHF